MKHVILVLTLGALALTACAPKPAPGLIEPSATQRPLPTYTPYPTFTPLPTAIPATAVPKPTTVQTQTPVATATIPLEVRIFDNVMEKQDRGGMSVRVTGIRVASFAMMLSALDESDRATFQGMDAWKDVQTTIAMGLEVENASGKKLSVYPDQGTVIVGDEQVSLSSFLLFSEDVGGDVFPGVLKKGVVLFGLKRTAWEDVASLRFVFDPPHDENYQRVAEEAYDFTIPLK